MKIADRDVVVKRLEDRIIIDLKIKEGECLFNYNSNNKTAVCGGGCEGIYLSVALDLENLNEIVSLGTIVSKEHMIKGKETIRRKFGLHDVESLAMPSCKYLASEGKYAREKIKESMDEYQKIYELRRKEIKEIMNNLREILLQSNKAH